MKKLLYFSFFIFSFSLCNGQSWLWAKAAVSDSIGGFTDPMDLTTDNSGSIFETGGFSGHVNFGTVSFRSPLTDGFLMKFDNHGNSLWGVAPVTSSQAYGTGLATDKSGNVCLVGFYSSQMSIGSYTYPISNGNLLYAAMFTSSGVLKWAANCSSTARNTNVQPNSVVIDKWGNSYITGYFQDSASFGPFHLNIYNTSCFFLAKLDSTGTVLWVNTGMPHKSSNWFSYGSTLVTDTAGNIFLTGSFGDSLTINSTTIVTKGNSDVFLAKFTPSGSLSWLTSGTVQSSTSLISNENNNGLGERILANDNTGNLYTTGVFYDTVQFGPYSLTAQGYGIYLAKYSPGGNLLWAKESHGGVDKSFWYAAYSLSCDGHCNLYSCGTYYDSIGFNAVNLSSTSTIPSFLFKFDSSGGAVCGASINNDNDDNNCVAADPLSNSVFFSGDIEVISDTTYCSFGSLQVSGTGVEYAFLAKWTCSDGDGIIQLSDPNGLVSVFPNPNNGVFTLEVKNEKLKVKNVDVYNILGEKVYSQFNIQNPTFNIDLSSKPDGVYFYRVINEDGSMLGNGKVVIQK